MKKLWHRFVNWLFNRVEVQEQADFEKAIKITGSNDQLDAMRYSLMHLGVDLSGYEGVINLPKNVPQHSAVVKISCRYDSEHNRVFTAPLIFEGQKSLIKIEPPLILCSGCILEIVGQTVIFDDSPKNS